jgi:hypothetical protein
LHNKAVNTDAQGRPLAALAPVLGRGLLPRYASRSSRVVLVATVLSFCAPLSMAADWLGEVPQALWPRSDWQELPSGSFAEVPVSRFFVTRIELAEKAFVPQSPSAASSILGREFECAKGSQPYLVRALFTIGGTGRFNILWAKDSLVVEHGSLGTGNVKGESALIACLSRPPAAVFSHVASAL